MKNFIILFLLSIATSFTQLKAQWVIEIQYEQGICGTREAALLINHKLDSIYQIAGSNIAILEINGYSHETVAGLPLCQCRKDIGQRIVNNWLNANSLPLGNLTNCYHNPNVSNDPNYRKLTILVDSFL